MRTIKLDDDALLHVCDTNFERAQQHRYGHRAVTEKELDEMK